MSRVRQNSQCSIAMGSSTTVAVSGTTLTLNLAMTFKPAFAGAKSIFAFAANPGGVNSGWAVERRLDGAIARAPSSS
jgi:hypothetical protein